MFSFRKRAWDKSTIAIRWYHPKELRNECCNVNDKVKTVSVGGWDSSWSVASAEPNDWGSNDKSGRIDDESLSGSSCYSSHMFNSMRHLQRWNISSKIKRSLSSVVVSENWDKARTRAWSQYRRWRHFGFYDRFGIQSYRNSGCLHTHKAKIFTTLRCVAG